MTAASGRATVVIAEPKDEIACPDQSLKNSGCRRSMSHWLHGMAVSLLTGSLQGYVDDDPGGRALIISTMTERVELGDAAEVPDGGLKTFKTGDTAVVVARVGGRYCSVNYRCPHMGGNLGRGRLEAGAVV